MIGIEQRPVSAIAAEVYDGLRKKPKSLSCWLFYDAAGSALFEEITRLPQYYLTRTEWGILQAHADEICKRAGTNLNVVELGAGNAKKTRAILASLLRRQMRVEYVPVDISATALEAANGSLAREFPQISVRPIVADYVRKPLPTDGVPGRKLVLYLGSSIGNFEHDDAIVLLRRVRDSIRPGDALLLGTDLVKDAGFLVAAYDDPAGVTARFNKNMLARINRELGGHFDLDEFRHVAVWNADKSRMEMYLESVGEQVVAVDALNLDIHFGAGERLHTENSYKYTVPFVEEMLIAAGFRPEAMWAEAQNWFSVHLGRAT